MDAFKAQWDRVREQLAGLTASQRMLVGTLVAVMALTLGYWGRYAGSPEMTPVLDQVLTEDAIGPIDRQLDLSGIPHNVVAGKVMVPADRKQEALANLMFAQALPADTHSAFEEMSAKNLNWFSSATEREAVYNHATELELAATMRRWPGVADARVVINCKNDRRIGETVPPTATVDLRTRGGSDKPATRQLVQAAADGCTGAVSGLLTQNIRVIVNGVSMRPASADAPGLDASNEIEQRERNEAAYEQKVHSQFSFIPNLTVTVTCDVNTQTRDEHVTKYNKADAFAQVTHSRTQSGEQTTADATGPREPGVASNDGLSGPGGADANGNPASGPVTTNQTSTSDEDSQSTPYVSGTDAHISTPAGKTTVVSAAVTIPMSYVTRQFHTAHPSVKDLTDADLQQAAAAEVAKVRDRVATVVGLADATRVSVDTYADDVGLADLPMAAAAGPANPSAALGTLSAHGKEIAVAVLAIISLGLMFQATRRSTIALPVGSTPTLAGLGMNLNAADFEDDDEADGRTPIGGRGPDVSQAALLIDGMEGMELDAETVRTQQMLDQVSTLVKEDPDAAAALVKRWVSRA